MEFLIILFLRVYYVCMVINLFLRATWVLQISPDIYSSIGLNSAILTYLIAFLELCRRGMWNLFRVEYQYLL
jgi:xenotropic and polytropic retrovirus receptor 1